MGKREKMRMIHLKTWLKIWQDASDFYPEYKHHIDEVIEEMNRLKKMVDFSYLVTISFDDKKIMVGQSDLHDLPKLIESKLARHPQMKWYCYSIEQRSEDINELHGFHVHIILRPDAPKRPSHIKREYYSSFKDYVDNIRFVDVRKIDVDNGVEEYISGDKKDVSKSEKVKVDKFMREKYNYLTIYYNGSSSV